MKLLCATGIGMKIILVLLFSIFAVEAKSQEFVFDSWQEKGESCELRFSSLPVIEWNGKSKLPITFENVRSIFNKWALKNLESSEMAHVVSYNLASVAAGGLTQSHWVFKVSYVVFKNNVPVTHFNRKLAITLDGEVLKPKCSGT